MSNVSFQVQKRSNFYDGRYHRDEWRINKVTRTTLITTQSFCEVFGTRKVAMEVAALLTAAAQGRIRIRKHKQC